MIDFPDKEKGEEIIIIARRHWALFWGHFFIYVIYFLIPIIVLILVSNFLISGLSEFTFFPLIILGISLYYIFWWFLFFKSWVDYYFDAWIITGRRLIDINQKGFFNHTVAELRLDKIQDITVEIKGFFPSIFNYGTIKVQTASDIQLFAVEEISKPEKIKNLILNLQEKMARK